jgi:hypothetical protein
MWSFLLRETSIFCGTSRRGRTARRNLKFESRNFREMREMGGRNRGELIFADHGRRRRRVPGMFEEAAGAKLKFEV